MRRYSIILLLLIMFIPLQAAYAAGWIGYGNNGDIATATYEYDHESGYYIANSTAGWYKQFAYLPDISLQINHSIIYSPSDAVLEFSGGIMSFFHDFGSKRLWMIIYYKFDKTENQTYSLILRKIQYDEENRTISVDESNLMSIEFSGNISSIDHVINVKFYIAKVVNGETLAPESAKLYMEFSDKILGSYSKDAKIVLDSATFSNSSDANSELAEFCKDSYGWWVWLGVGYIYTSPVDRYLYSYAYSNTSSLYLREKLTLIALFDSDSPTEVGSVRYQTSSSANIIPLIPVIVGVVTAFAFKSRGLDKAGVYIGLMICGGLSLLLGIYGLAIASFLGLAGVLVVDYV
mgnify:CR=1 FL=1